MHRFRKNAALLKSISYKYPFFLAVLLLLASCLEKKQEPIVAPWGVIDDTVTVAEDFDLHDIQTSGELIMATVSGPEAYYDYRGKPLGTQYLICQRFADSLGVRLRVDVCRDSSELVKKLDSGEADLIAWPTPGHIEADREKSDLVAELKKRVAESQEPVVILTVGAGDIDRLVPDVAKALVNG